MANAISEYKCPACTGPLHFSEKTGRLECEYCGSSFTVEEVEALMAKKDAEAVSGLEQKEAKDAKEAEELKKLKAEGLMDESWDGTAEGIVAYSCPSCGAELFCDQNTAATSCPYCGNNAIVPGKLSGIHKPDYVIPFKFGKDEAIAALKRHYQYKVFLPNAFSDQNHIEEIKGVYVPFWLFDCTADVNADYDATNSNSHHEGEYLVTTTKHYDVHREGSVSFQKVPVDASTKMPDGHMDSIEPFDYREMRPFSTAYLPGFLADKYDVNAEESAKRADERVKTSAVAAVGNSVSGFEAKSVKRQSVMIRDRKAHYALLPVWMLNTKWNGQNFLFAMNGQTGKLVGDLPVDQGKYAKRTALMALAVGIPLAIILILVGL